MARARRVTLANHVYHVMNRAAKRTVLFSNASDYLQFERTLESALARFPMRLLAYCIMPTHFHLLLWPRQDGDVSRFIKWLTATHARRWNETHGTTGGGAVYQGRFRCVWVENDQHLLRAWKYIERNPLNADLVARAEDWRWCSLWRRMRGPYPHSLCDGPLDLPADWTTLLNAQSGDSEIAQSRKSGSDPRTGTGVRPQANGRLTCRRSTRDF
jgi:putative transposase